LSRFNDRFGEAVLHRRGAHRDSVMLPMRMSLHQHQAASSALQTLARSRPAAVIGSTPADTTQICEASRDGEAEGRCASGTKKKKNDRTAGR